MSTPTHAAQMLTVGTDPRDPRNWITLTLGTRREAIDAVKDAREFGYRARLVDLTTEGGRALVRFPM